ncbi:transcriptional regulator [Azotobacter chroococcum]|uniref:helix-turn-helix domain-containing protein n=1 Tax=Azotobacter chroococcum TaxID=353 RepID=UPI00103AB892|nr:helix-turn-helix domain-containing protein [Azotobacter chroococcum]TBW09162.1 transcriptional regulator [Azotobacter chroococcum]
MRIEIISANDIGPVVRASRKAQSIRQDDAAGSIGVSESFMGKVESGGETVQWGKLFQVLEGLGVRVILDVPDEVVSQLAAAQQLHTRKQRAKAARQAKTAHQTSPEGPR